MLTNTLLRRLISPGELVASTAYENAKVIAARKKTLLSLSGFNNKNAAQFILVFDLAAAPSAAAAEISTVSLAGKTPAGMANKYFLLNDNVGSVYVWFNLDAGGVDPAPAGIARGISVAISTGNSAAQMATACASAVDGDSKFAATPSTSLVTITDSNVGARTDGGDGNAALSFTVTQQGVTAAVPKLVTTVATVASFDFKIPLRGIPFTNGIVVTNSSTGPIQTIGSADCWFQATISE